MPETDRLLDYYRQLRRPYVKLCRLRFLNPDGSTAFAVDNNPYQKRNRAFISDGNISVNLQNGQRRTASVTLSNVDGEFDYNVNKLWFGNQVALDEGLVLSDGTDYYIQQGVFLLETPVETVSPTQRTIQYNLIDKWGNLDGTLFGNLEATYEVASGTNIFTPIQALLNTTAYQGYALDNKAPVYTEYYNNKTQAVPSGGTVDMTNSPYTLTVDGDSGTFAEIILGLAGMVNAWVGYDASGRLRIDPSQDDILDNDKPILWEFSQDEAELLGLTYTIKNTEVYNDFVVIGEQLENYEQPVGRAQNQDPSSDTNINIIGLKTTRYSAAGYATNQQCEDLAVWKLKRAAILQKSVTISCTQMFHIEENKLVTVVRTDKEGSPMERHLITGFSRPLAGGENMTINVTSVNDFPIATLVSWGRVEV